MKRENAKNPFVDRLVSKAGYPYWDKALIFTTHGSRSTLLQGKETGEAGASSVIFIPFAKDTQQVVCAALRVTMTPIGDTIVKVLYGWQYNDSVTTGMKPRHLSLLLMKLDNIVFGHETFHITDSSAFGGLGKKIDFVRVIADSSIPMQGLMMPVNYTLTVCYTLVYPGYCDGQVHGVEPGQNPYCTEYHCESVSWTEWEDDGSGGGGGGHGNEGGGGGGYVNSCRAIPGDSDPCGGGHGSTGWGPVDDIHPFIIESIVDTAVADPCLKNVIDSIIGQSGHQSQLNAIYGQFHTQTDKYKFLYRQDTALQTSSGNLAAGHTDVDTLAGGILQVTITLNPKYLENASKEFVAATIFHEILHAYFRIKYPTLTLADHHNLILNGWGSHIVSALNEVFPTSLTDPYDVRSLALQGIDDVILQTNPVTGNQEIIPSQNNIALQYFSIGLLAARETALEFLNGTKGTACN